MPRFLPVLAAAVGALWLLAGCGASAPTPIRPPVTRPAPTVGVIAPRTALRPARISRGASYLHLNPYVTNPPRSTAARRYTLTGTGTGFTNPAAPTIGETLSTSNGTWTGSPTSYTYQWQRCDFQGLNCANISGATSSTYTVGASDNDTELRSVVTAVNAGGSTSTPAAPTEPSIVSHIPVYAYDNSCGEGSGTSTTLVRAWVTYADANCGIGETKALTDCHTGAFNYCYAVQYLDTNWIYSVGSNFYPAFNNAAASTWWMHEPSPNQTTQVTCSTGCAAYTSGSLINQQSTAAQAWWDAAVQANFNNFDGLFMDDQSAGISSLTYASICGNQGGVGNSNCASATNEDANDAALQAAHASMSSALTHTGGAAFPQFNNSGNGGGNPNLDQGMGMVAAPANGYVSEGAPVYNGTLESWAAALLDDAAYIDNSTSSGMLVPLSTGSGTATTAERLDTEAWTLLAYSPGHLAPWDCFDYSSGCNDSDIEVWPEEGIVPTEPVTSMQAPSGANCFAINGSLCNTHGHNDLQATTGVYVREFADCYNQGVLFGVCAAVLNTTGAGVTISGSWLTQTYHHELTLSSATGDVQAGGTVNLTGASFTAGTTTLGAGLGAILTP